MRVSPRACAALACMSVCLSAYLPAFLTLCLSVCLLASLCACKSVCLAWHFSKSKCSLDLFYFRPIHRFDSFFFFFLFFFFFFFHIVSRCMGVALSWLTEAGIVVRAVSRLPARLFSWKNHPQNRKTRVRRYLIYSFCHKSDKLWIAGRKTALSTAYSEPCADTGNMIQGKQPLLAATTLCKLFDR